jgi:hypothetical protein
MKCITGLGCPYLDYQFPDDVDPYLHSMFHHLVQTLGGLGSPAEMTAPLPVDGGEVRFTRRPVGKYTVDVLRYGEVLTYEDPFSDMWPRDAGIFYLDISQRLVTS